jgi:putative transposase
VRRGAAATNGERSAKHRNGYSKKTVNTDTSQVELEIPRDRRSTFEPQLIALHARGMSARDIQGHWRELYGIDASPQLISTVTDAIEEVGRWQSRPLDALYAIVFLDSGRVVCATPQAPSTSMPCA